MPIKEALLIIFFICMSSANTSASDEPSVATTSSSASSDGVKKKIFELEMYPGQGNYPVAIAQTGLQGSVIVEIALDAEFKVISAKVKESSRDSVVDEMAVNFLLKPIKLKYKEGDNYSRSEIKISYKRENIFSYKLKACKDINIDAEYFKKINPEKPISEMEFWTVTSGMMFVLYSNQKSYLSQDSNKILEGSIAECLANPDANVFDIYMKVAKIKPTK